MKILVLNPPHKSIGSRKANEHLPPLGLLCIAGPLIDRGHNVKLLDAEFGPMKNSDIVSEIMLFNPELVLTGHSGSTSAQPIINEILQLVKNNCRNVITILGGVFPTYHWQEILEHQKQIDFIVCGEGEETIVELVNAIESNESPETVKGIAFRKNSHPYKTEPRAVIKDLDKFRIAWELIENYNYTYWGKKKAVVIQFSRGCPWPCTYCGQSLFWKKWRHRNPQLLADEIEMLHKKYGIEVINFADENPSTNKKAWKEFLEALINKNLPLILVGSIRADNIVRDKDFLHLYKKAGFERFLLGIENYDDVVLDKIKKAGTITKDKEAITLLRQHGILSMATYVIGFGEEKTKDFYKSLRQLLSYDPDQVQLLYVTPHKWTPYFEEIKHKKIVQRDQTKWDYKHQVLAMDNLPPWLVIVYVKIIEVLMQTRPKSVYRLFFHREKRLRKAMEWYTRIGRRVWLYELSQFFFRDKISNPELSLGDYWK